MTSMPKKRKLTIAACTYACALFAVLAAYAALAGRNLADYRLAARYSASRALEETVTAVENMSAALDKAVYATDGAMCARLSAEVYANALAAESALSTLPFATQEMERISAYLNEVGDYAYTLGALSASSGYAEGETDTLAKLGELAGSLRLSLEELRERYHNGALEMDSGEIKLANLSSLGTTERVSEALLSYESEFPRHGVIKYDGRYGAKAVSAAAVGQKRLSDAEKLAVAAAFAGVSPAQVRLAYSYEGAEGLKCYRALDALVVVGEQGVVSMGRERLVGEETLTAEQAQRAAHEFLEKRGYADMTLTRCESSGGMARMSFASTQHGALYEDNLVTLAVALDDGTLCAFNAEGYTAAEEELTWELDEKSAAESAPEGVSVEEISRVIIRSAGGEARACYKLKCADGESKVDIYVNAVSGLQERITLKQ